MAASNDMTASLALDLVVDPILTEIGKGDTVTIQLLRTAIHKAERANPGFTVNFISGICASESMALNVAEIMLLMASLPCSEYELTRPESEFQNLNHRASHLKGVLSKIPQDIKTRSQFLHTVKKIADAIRELLDAINELHRTHPDVGRMREFKQVLDIQKRTFVKRSRVLSDNLKMYFRNSRADDVFSSANSLVNQTNTLLRTFLQATSSN